MLFAAESRGTFLMAPAVEIKLVMCVDLVGYEKARSATEADALEEAITACKLPAEKIMHAFQQSRFGPDIITAAANHIDQIRTASSVESDLVAAAEYLHKEFDKDVLDTKSLSTAVRDMVDMVIKIETLAPDVTTLVAHKVVSDVMELTMVSGFFLAIASLAKTGDTSAVDQELEVLRGALADYNKSCVYGLTLGTTWEPGRGEPFEPYHKVNLR